jgi:hypothetical protein
MGKLEGFLSTPKFINCLTDISSNLSLMKNVPKSVKLTHLKQNLKRINSVLPAAVYIPFVN